MNEPQSIIIKHCMAARKSHVNAALAVVFVVAVLAGACHRSEEDEIRASFVKTPDYLLGTQHRCQAFVLYTFARIEDIPDETRKMKVLREFTDNLFSVDLLRFCPLENVGWEEKRDSMHKMEQALVNLRWASKEARNVLRMSRLPVSECWEIEFRYLEQYKRHVEKVERITGHQSFDYDTLARGVERDILCERDHGEISPSEFSLLRMRFEEVTGKPMGAREESETRVGR